MKRNSGVTLLGLLALVAVLGIAICGFLYLGKLMVASAEDSAKKRQAKMDEASGEEDPQLSQLGRAPLEQMALSTPGTTWTPLTNDPGWFIVEIPDEEFWEAVDSYQTWAILESQDLVTWRDTGTRLDGTLWSVKQDLRNWATNEAPIAMWGGSHAHGMTHNFFVPIDPSQVRAPSSGEGK